ncbi:hypothetical protein Tco_0638819, partial [Tanacetum coccineum]
MEKGDEGNTISSMDENSGKTKKTEDIPSPHMDEPQNEMPVEGGVESDPSYPPGFEHLRSQRQ